jgi:hypothetical protein
MSRRRRLRSGESYSLWRGDVKIAVARARSGLEEVAVDCLELEGSARAVERETNRSYSQAVPNLWCVGAERERRERLRVAPNATVNESEPVDGMFRYARDRRGDAGLLARRA